MTEEELAAYLKQRIKSLEEDQYYDDYSYYRSEGKISAFEELLEELVAD